MIIYLWGHSRYLSGERVFDFLDLDLDIKFNTIRSNNGLDFTLDVKNKLRKATRKPIGPKLAW